MPTTFNTKDSCIAALAFTAGSILTVLALPANPQEAEVNLAAEPKLETPCGSTETILDLSSLSTLGLQQEVSAFRDCQRIEAPSDMRIPEEPDHFCLAVQNLDRAVAEIRNYESFATESHAAFVRLAARELAIAKNNGLVSVSYPDSESGSRNNEVYFSGLKEISWVQYQARGVLVSFSFSVEDPQTLAMLNFLDNCRWLQPSPDLLVQPNEELGNLNEFPWPPPQLRYWEEP